MTVFDVVCNNLEQKSLHLPLDLNKNLTGLLSNCHEFEFRMGKIFQSNNQLFFKAIIYSKSDLYL